MNQLSKYLFNFNKFDYFSKIELNEEGIYRKNGVSHRITQFIERNFTNISNLNQQSTNTTNSNNVSITLNNDHNHTNGITNDHNSSSSQNSSFISNVLKSANIPIISHSSSFSTLSFLVNHQTNSNSKETNGTNGHSNHENNSTGSASPSTQTQIALGRNNSSSNLSTDTEDTCTITSALKHYLIHLKEPLMTFSFNQQFLIACRKENITEKIVEIHKLLHQLPPLNFEALELLMNHLHKYFFVFCFE
jgi:hypothetical protein